MKVIKVVIKDFKCIKNLDQDVNGNNIILLGDNGVGKSSFIQFIEIALGKNSSIPPNTPITGEVITNKDGEQYTFSVSYKGDKPVITVIAPNGMKDNRKGVIAGIVGANEFDIDNFVNLSKTKAGRKEQVEQFKKFLDEETRKILDTCEANVDFHYQQRTELTKDITKLKGSIQLNPMINYIATLKNFAPVDVGATMGDLKKAQEKNAQITDINNKVLVFSQEVERNEKEVESLQKRIDELNESTSLLTVKIISGNEWLEKNKLINCSTFEEVINSATETNKKADQAKSLLSDMEKLSKLEEDHGHASALIDSERQTILDAIRDMDGPIDGLTFDNDQLYYNGVAVDDNSLSTSEIVELGIRLKRAENPELPILIQCGESLGSKRLKEIQAFAKKEDFQIIMEQVQRDTKELKIEIMPIIE